ncbi:MAG: sulfite exporter TauE/SafE family protein [bacterium]|nr:MAG: sulfite exporter TauE/SafE family protein [bacterium]
MLLNFVTQTSASVTYLRKRLMDIVAGLPLLITSAIFPVIGVNFTQRLPTSWIILIIGMILIAVGSQTFFNWKQSEQTFSRRQKIIVGLVAGSVIGFVIGFIGHGGGSFVVPTLLILGFAPKKAAATSSFICAFSSLTGFLTHASQAQINWSLYFPGVIAAVIGSQLGSRFMVVRMKNETLKRMFAAVLFLIGVQLIMKEFFF